LILDASVVGFMLSSSAAPPAPKIFPPLCFNAVPDKNLRQFLLKNLGRDEAGQLRWKPNVAALHANYDHIRRAVPPEIPFAGPAGRQSL